ncbi:unnamed protein product [Paramecium pentaurelia]|uniref:Uncharacterized protein n=1 Tax=Paramecium pentaurelia TaxID=43138 RepID=A0A8S1XAL5_9CILI|nr:unnamed protein product [Paramecium pentaurelia]
MFVLHKIGINVNSNNQNLAKYYAYVDRSDYIFGVRAVVKEIRESTPVISKIG